MPATNDSVTNEVLAHRMGGLEDSLDEIKHTVKNISETLIQMARLDEKHNSTVAAVARAHTRLDALDKDNDDCTKRTTTLERSVEGHTWLLRLLAGGLVSLAVGLLVTLAAFAIRN